MYIPEEFNDMRPYNPDEIAGVVDELSQDPDFRAVVERTFPQPFEAIIQKARSYTSLLELQKNFSYKLMKDLMDKLTKGTDMDAGDLDRNGSYTFMSNHRDIVLDSGFLSKLLLDCGFRTTIEIAIGDNLLTIPWIHKIVRLNKAFIVKRSVHGREKLLASMKLGSYIHFAINEKKENVWIAQRQGRAKDSDDRTQDSVLKMMAFGGEGTIIERLKSLNIVPLSISYEYDPCDFLKAKEMQMRRDNPDYQKSKMEDVISMDTGIHGYKGHVHYQAAACINGWLDSLDANLPKNDVISLTAEHIDQQIHSNYHLYAGNYIAYDMLNQTARFEELYSQEEAEKFEAYLRGQIEKIDLESRDYDYLMKCLLNMYTNPLVNYLKASGNN